MRILFVVMSAVHDPSAIDELARALQPHVVLVHHDFAQRPGFRLTAPNVRLVPDPKRTGWACWGFSEGIFHALAFAVASQRFDYLQLLSPTCLPIKPIHRFERHVASTECDAHFDYVDLLDDRDALMSVGYRAFSPENSFRHRVLRRLAVEYYRSDDLERRDVAGIQLRQGHATDARGRMTFRAKLAHRIMQVSARPSIGRHIFDEALRPSFGSVWFGARRQVVARMLELFEDPRLRRYFSKLHIADEFLMPSLLRRSACRPGPSNTLVNTFVNANPAWFEDTDFHRIQASPAFFARKFRDDPLNSIRRRVLDELAGSAGRAQPIVLEQGA